MTHVYAPHGGEGRRPSANGTRPREPDFAEHCACCVTGLVAVSLTALLVYPVLVAATRPLQLLSSTAIVFVLVFLWLLVWVAIEIAWEWRAGRIPVER